MTRPRIPAGRTLTRLNPRSIARARPAVRPPRTISLAVVLEPARRELRDDAFGGARELIAVERFGFGEPSAKYQRFGKFVLMKMDVGRNQPIASPAPIRAFLCCGD